MVLMTNEHVLVRTDNMIAAVHMLEISAGNSQEPPSGNLSVHPGNTELCNGLDVFVEVPLTTSGS